MAFGNVAIAVEIAAKIAQRIHQARLVRQPAANRKRDAAFALLTLYRTPFQVNVVIISGGIMSEFVHGESEP
jgi:hypothetical protein